MDYLQALKNRRSQYDLEEASPITDTRIEEILADVITYTPSAFHSQSSRVVLLLHEEHKKLWELTSQVLRKIVPAENFSQTEKKMQSFSTAYGTILFFEDLDTIENLQKSFAIYAENFPIWSQQSAGMLQFSVWTALSQEGLGASLQHYNPLIDEAVKEKFNIPEKWKLIAQMPFGTPKSDAKPINYLPIEKRLKVMGGLK